MHASFTLEPGGSRSAQGWALRVWLGLAAILALWSSGAEGGQRMGRLTAECRGERLAIILDGAVLSAPWIQDRIGRRGVISGHFTDAEARRLATLLHSGALPGALERIEP